MKFYLFFILVLMVFSCGDNNTSTKVCNPECEEWQECENEKCVTKKDFCNQNDDCQYTYVCNTETHKCIEDDVCRPICNNNWQECINKHCVSKEDFCKDDFECLNGYICDMTEHKCINDCEQIVHECEIGDKLCDGQNLKFCEETKCGNIYKTAPCESNYICNNGECINPDCIDECEIGNNICSGYNKIKTCEQTDCGKKLKEVTCEVGKGCKNGDCITDYCSDECNPNEENCELWDMKTGDFTTTEQNNILYDRNEEYLKWLYSKNMFFGGVVEAYFQDETLLETILSYGGVGDSAIWTGTYLGAESFRFMATGSIASYKNIKTLINLLHIWFNVSGYDGLIVRYAAETELLNNSTMNTEDMTDCNNPNGRVYCNVEYNGKRYNYKGHISRDQYQGILLGYSLAYTALGNSKDELELKALIRTDILELVKQLMKKTTLDIKYEVYDDRIPANPLDPTSEEGVVKGETTIDARFVVVSPREFQDGKVIVKYCSVETPECETNFKGFQEFMPDLKPFLKQLSPLLGFLPYIPRSGSAIMLPTIFNIALQVTKDINGYETDYNNIKNFYYNNNDEWENVNSWLDSAEQWTYLNKCGEKYYGINITMEPLYNLLRLETNTAIRERILNNVLIDKIWDEVKSHKNPFFSYIYLSALENTDGAALNTANEQFLGFPSTPKRHFEVNLLDATTYPQYASREDGCDAQVEHSTAVDVKDREMSDFIWQRKPWALQSGANPKRIYPGIDFLIVYWMGQYYNFLEEDSNSRCFRYR